MRRLRHRASAWSLLSALALLSCRCGDGEAPPPPRPAPSFTLSDLEGHTVSLSDFQGQILVIDFWATWCAPCVVQIPVLNRFYEETRGAGVAVLGIAMDADGSEVVAPFALEHAISYPVLLGDIALAHRYGASGFPATVIVDATGHIHSLHVGVVKPDDLRDAVAQARVQAASLASPPNGV